MGNAMDGRAIDGHGLWRQQERSCFRGSVAPGWGRFNCGLAPWRPNSNLERDADLWDQHGIAAHFRDEFVGRLVDDGKGPVMAGDHPFELEEALAGERRGFRPYGESVSDRHDADVGAIDLVDQPHVRKDRGVTHMVNRLALARGNDEPAAGAEINRAPLVEHAGRMPGRHEGDIEIFVMDRAASVAWIDVFHPEARHVGGEFKDCDERYCRLLADLDGIAGMIFMAMGQRHMGHALRDLPNG